MLLLAITKMLPDVAWWSLLAVLAVVGMVATCSPRVFGSLASRSNSWVDTNKLLEVLDRRVDIDHAVMPFTRVLGIAVLAAVIMLGVLWART